MADIDLSQFHDVFVEESLEGLDVMESGLLGLNLDTPDPETINNVFRAAHSIKGGAGTFGFVDIADVTHILETILDEVRSQEIRLTDNLIQLLLESVDYLKHMLAACKSGQKISLDEKEAFIQKLATFHTAEASSEPAPAAVAASDDEVTLRDFLVTFEPHEHLFESGIDPYRLFRELATLGDLESTVIQSRLPLIDEMDPEKCYLGWELKLNHSHASYEEVTEIFEWVTDDAVFSVTEMESEAPSATAVTKPDISASPDTALPEASSIRVNVDRIDLLVNLVGELVITQSMLSRFKEGVSSGDLLEFARGIEQLEDNARELQEHTMQIRMLPIDNVFQRMPRLVRDLCISLDKQVRLVLNGKNTEVDRTVLEKISDPLTHLVRNCLDHGIEPTEDRIALGKPEEGKVEISAFHDGGNIIIDVQDDGRGLNREAIRNKAISSGIIEADTELTDHQIDHLIFTPGFSTAAEVSDVSGRGVGMDVVKNNIEQINGHIDVKSEPGKGSKFTIKLPLTLAIIDGQLVRVGKDILIIPLLNIVKSTRIDPADYNLMGGGSAMFRLEEDYLPIIPLNDVYQISSDHQQMEDGILVIVDAVDRFGILVDEVLGQQQVVVKGLEKNFRRVPSISGATILGDGTVAMILDVAGLLQKFRTDQKREKVA